MKGFLQCMIIHSYGGTYSNDLRAIPMEKPLQNSTSEAGSSITLNEQGGISDIRCYVKKDINKELSFSLYDILGAQKSKCYYLECIEVLFRGCSKSGGTYVWIKAIAIHGCCVYVYVCVCQLPHSRHGNTSLACLVLWQSSTPDSDRVVETRQSQGSLGLVLQANNRDTSCIQCTRWCMHLDQGLKTQIPAIVHGPSTPLGVLPCTWPKFKACKSVTQHPSAGSGGTSRGLGARQAVHRFTGCSYVFFSYKYTYCIRSSNTQHTCNS